jgi:hypothetical protein
MKTQTFLRIALAATITALVGCSSPQIDTSRLAPPDSSQARICFTRQSSMLGAIVPHFVVDRGTGIRANALVRQKTPSSPERFNVDQAGNVTYLERSIIGDIYDTKIPFSNSSIKAYYVQDSREIACHH